MNEMNRRQKEEKRYQRFLNNVMQSKEADKSCACVLHPQGNVRLLWDISSLVMLSYDCIMTPLQLMVDEETTAVFVCGWVVNGFWTFDIVVSLLTGFYKDAVLIANWRPIMANYMSKNFIFDFVVILPDWVTLFFESDPTFSKSLSTLRVLKMIRFL